MFFFVYVFLSTTVFLFFSLLDEVYRYLPARYRSQMTFSRTIAFVDIRVTGRLRENKRKKTNRILRTDNGCIESAHVLPVVNHNAHFRRITLCYRFVLGNKKINISRRSRLSVEKNIFDKKNVILRARVKNGITRDQHVISGGH